MKKNMGTIDKVVRVIVAITIAILAYAGVIKGTLAIVLLAVAAIFVLTSLIGTCPLYLPFGLSSAKKKE
ncbi:MAG: DUF2892 domain-containing protein [Bacteroidales bacterium]|nr:DUF2892 domain-containing protein [Bacteroidales bacterium]